MYGEFNCNLTLSDIEGQNQDWANFNIQSAK